ncbi:MAG: hypothetical protein KAX15_03995 [Candidatus Omnitrophica bacterium]|nr:hypothetical protein [Candidatus Omnitrophota bacterium]
MNDELLREELEFFEEKKDEWLTLYAEKYALVKGKKLINTFTTFQEAYDVGVTSFSVAPFLVKQIIGEEPVEEVPALMLGLIHANI